MNTTDGTISLIEKPFSSIQTTDEIEIGMEATSHYWLSLYSFLMDKGFVVYVVNPIQTDCWRKEAENVKQTLSILF